MIDVRTAYGAVGDGLADDTQAVQDALTAEGWAYVPAGTYRMTSPLRPVARRRLTLAPGATLIRDHDDVLLTNTPTGGGGGGYDGYGGILLEGGILDCRGTVRSVNSGGLAVAHGYDITIRDMTIRDVYGWHAIEVNSSKTVRIRDCKFEGFLHDGTRGFSEAIQLDSAISAGAYPWGGPYDNTACEDVLVSGCWVGASDTPGTTAWPRGVGSHSAGPNLHRAVKVQGCTFDRVLDCGVQTYGWDGALISGNHVLNSGGEGIAVRNNSRYVEVADNQVHDSGRSGIWVNTDCTQIGVRDNEVIGSGASEDLAHYGIRASTRCTSLRIVGNTVRRRASGNAAKYGLSITADCSGVHRYGNTLQYSGATGSLSDSSSSPVTSANDAL